MRVRVRVIGGRGGGGGAGTLRWRVVGGRWMKVKLNSAGGAGPRQVGGEAGGWCRKRNSGWPKLRQVER